MAKNRGDKLRDARLLISNAIHALDMLDDMDETMEQLLNAYTEIKEAEEFEDDSTSHSAGLSNGRQRIWREKVEANYPVVERWKNISVLR